MRRAESFLIRELPAEAMTIFSEAKDDIDNYLKIGLDGAGGSPLYWYTIDFGLDNTPPDTGDVADSGDAGR